MIRRFQYRCSFKESAKTNKLVEACKERAKKLVKEGKLCNVSFYRYENMGFLYVEEITGDEPENSAQPAFDAEALMKELIPALKPWPREEGDVFFVPMINVYYHHIPDDDLKAWEQERTTAEKTRVGRIAFVFPDKMPSYVKHHTAIVEEGLLKGDKYQYISMHENILFSYYEEPRNNVNLSGRDEKSKAIEDWLAVDPESHFDRVKAKGDNFLVIPCLFTVDRVDREFKSGNLWRCCYDPQNGRYTAETGGGPNHNLYEITKEIYDKVDTLENSEADNREQRRAKKAAREKES